MLYINNFNSKFLDFVLLSISGFILYFLIKYASRDVSSYFELFHLMAIHNNNFMDFYYNSPDQRFEIGSLFILWNFLQVLSYTETFFLFGYISLVLKYFLFKKYLPYPRLTFVIYVCVFSFLYEASQIRQSLVLVFLFYIVLVPNNFFIKTFVYIIIASLFHYIAFYFLAIYSYLLSKDYFKGSRDYIFSVIICGIILIIIKLIIEAKGYGILILYHTLRPANIFSVPFILQSIIAISIFLSPNKINFVQKKSLFFLITSLIIFIIFSENSLIANRFREVGFVLTIPLLFSGFKYYTIHIYIAFVAFSIIAIFYIYNNLVMLIHKPFVLELIEFNRKFGISEYF